MAYEERQGWCPTCQRRTVVKRKGINHILHLLLTIVTLGLWVFVWLLTPLLRQPWMCTVCGSTRVLTQDWQIQHATVHAQGGEIARPVRPVNPPWG